jgi:hypothetical protein
MKYSKALASLTLVAAAVASSGVQASTYELGVLDSSIADQEVIVGSGSFMDTFNFSILANSEVAASVQNNPLVKRSIFVRNIENLSLSLFNTNGTLSDVTDDSQIGSAILSGESSYDLLASGNYYAKVEGTAVGSSGGKYTITMSADPAPVPVPAAAWLLGSGLLGLVGIARRKEVA